MMVYQRQKKTADEASLLPHCSSSTVSGYQHYDSFGGNNTSNNSTVVEEITKEETERSTMFFDGSNYLSIERSNSQDDDDCFSAGDEEETSVLLPEGGRRRQRRRSSKKMTVFLLFGMALVAAGITLLLSSTTTTSVFESSSNDDDDHDYDYKYNTWSDYILNVPLLGSSHKHRAQRHADEAKDYLYLNPKHEKKERHHHHHKKKHEKHSKGEPLLGSSASANDLKAHTGCEGTVLIIRHCEKGSIREHCDYVGYERSVYLASLFGDHAAERYPTPSYLIAEAPGDRRNPKKKNFREIETLLPLAEKFNLTVDTSFSTLDMKSFTKYVQGLFRSGEMCGKLMVIAWKHSKIPRVATALGCGPSEGCPMDFPRDEFDAIVQVKFVYREPLHSESKHLKPPKESKWTIYGSVHDQDFDPLAFSKQVGDYPPGGTSHGARWRAFDHEIPERIVFDKKKKKATNQDKWKKWYKSSNR